MTTEDVLEQDELDISFGGNPVAKGRIVKTRTEEGHEILTIYPLTNEDAQKLDEFFKEYQVKTK